VGSSADGRRPKKEGKRRIVGQMAVCRFVVRNGGLRGSGGIGIKYRLSFPLDPRAGPEVIKTKAYPRTGSHVSDQGFSHVGER